MFEQIIIYGILVLAFIYVAYRIYGSVKKKQACSKCALMKTEKPLSSVSRKGTSLNH